VRALAAQGKLEEARPLAEEYLGLLRKGAEAKTSDAYRVNCYARALLMVEPADLRDPQLALEVARRAYEMSADSYHYNRYILSLALEANGDTESAIAMMRRAREHIALEDSEEHRQYETALVRMLERTGDADAAEDVYRETLAARREQAPEYPVEIAQSLARLGETLTRHGKAAESEYVLTECLDVLGAALPKDDWRVGEAMSLLGESLAAQGRQDVARTLLVEGLAVILDSPMAQSEYARLARRRLATFGHAEGIDPGHGDTPGSDRNARSSPDGGGAQNSTGSATAAGEVRNP
jgi:tetratricopeptide (TPR) repeat protein